VKLGIRAKLFLISLGLIVFSVVVAYAYMRTELETAVTQEIRKDLAIRAELIAVQASALPAPLDRIAEWDALADDLGARSHARVTLIRADGTVVGDSDVPLGELSRVENHGERTEVRDALAGRHGETMRHSATVDRRMLYVAVPMLRSGAVAGVVRVSVPLTEVDEAVAHLRRILTIATLLALAVAVVMSSVAAELASRTARSLTAAARRMASGDLEARTRTLEQKDEFGELGRALDQLAESLSESLEALRGERDRLSGILSGMAEGVLVLDGTGHVALVNPALREMLLLGADAVGKTPLEVIRHAELKELLDDALAGGSSATGEIQLGGIKPRRLLVRAAPLGGEQEGVFAVFVDVTEMRRLETVRRDFVANVSHELRTPVTAIRSAAETLEGAMKNDPQAAVRFVEIIDRNAARLHGLVEDLLDLSRIESREFRLNLEPLDVRPILTHVLGLFRERAEKKRISLGLELSEDLPRALADRRALEHVLTNLVDNAVKYCGSGAEIALTAAVDGERVRVRISDTGPGIEERHLPRLFERFYRVDAGRSRELGGTGLGLSIVKNLVEAMGGRVGVESRLGEGTTFSFSLRLA
jgi:two-component system phosphate regulon sensor histidine kinase PhoR